LQDPEAGYQAGDSGEVESRDVRETRVPSRRKNEQRISDVENALLQLIVVVPAQTAWAAFALMMMAGLVHSLDPRIPAFGWWFCVGWMWGLLMLLEIIKTKVKEFRRKTWLENL